MVSRTCGNHRAQICPQPHKVCNFGWTEPVEVGAAMSDLNDELTSVRQLFKAGNYENALLLISKMQNSNEIHSGYLENELSRLLGFIYSRKESGFYDVDRAVEYYEKAAQEGDAVAQHALGGVLHEAGRKKEALMWYKTAGLSGRVECAALAYPALKLVNDDSWKDLLVIAAKGGHPFAVRDFAYSLIKGELGRREIFKGISMYVRNFPQLISRIIEAAKKIIGSSSGKRTPCDRRYWMARSVDIWSE